jgi:hypothetical protein
LGVFAGFMAASPCMLLGMTKPETFQSLGTVLGRLAAKLAAQRNSRSAAASPSEATDAVEAGPKAEPHAPRTFGPANRPLDGCHGG